MDGLGIVEIAGGIVSLLLSVIGYLLSSLLSDLKQLKVEQRELRDLCIGLKVEQCYIKDWIIETKKSAINPDTS